MISREWENWDKGEIAQAVDQRWSTSPVELEWRKILATDIETEIDGKTSMLEIGCGTGQIYGEMLKRQIVTDKSYTGGDISQKMLEIARHRFPEAKFTYLDILNLPYPDKSQPNVICIQVLQHLPHYSEAVKELIRITSGRLYITCWFNSGLKNQIVFGKTEWGASFYNNHYSLPRFLAFLYDNADAAIKSVCVKHLSGPSWSISLTLT